MHIYVVGNITVDESWALKTLPGKGESVSGNKSHQDIGGKGANQAVILSRCGLATTLIAGLGNDHYGYWIEKNIVSDNLRRLPVELLPVHTDTSLIFNTADGDNAIITTTSAAQALTPEMIFAALNDAQPGDILLQQGNFSAEKTRLIFEFARQRGMRTLFNPSPVNQAFAALWPLIDVAVVNQLEHDILQPVLKLADASLVITQGAAGSVLLQQGQWLHVSAIPAPVVDTTGAGDTFLAVMIASSLLRGVTIDALALRHASQAAALTVSRPGTWRAFPTRQELTTVLHTTA